MTSNAGAADMARPAYGFTRTKREGDDVEAISRMFAPEFRNRLDAVISFGHLPRQVIRQVVDKFIAQLEAQLADRAVTIELTDEAREWLADNGYDEAMGARPMGRLIQSTIKTPLADEVLFGRLKNGGAVRVVVVASETTGLKVLGFEFPEGKVTPKPEKDVENAATKRGKGSRAKGKSSPKSSSPRKKDPGNDMSKFLPAPGNADKPPARNVRTVPKVPLSKG
jgi:ATP-dependent Clp protease ATP-binding subunit ClpA